MHRIPIRELSHEMHGNVVCATPLNPILGMFWLNDPALSSSRKRQENPEVHMVQHGGVKGHESWLKRACVAA